MKFIYLIVAISAIALFSCSKEEAATPALLPGEHLATLTFEGFTTRAGSAPATAWEKQISDITILAFNEAGKQLLRRDDITPAQLSASAATPISMVLPGVSTGDKCYFVVVANRTIAATVNTRAALELLLEEDVASYNGTYADVSTKALRTGGFVMSGGALATIAQGTTAVTITVKRPVAKVTLTSKKSAAFTAKYGAAEIIVNSATLSRGASSSYLVDQTTSKWATYTTAQTHTQNAVKVGQTYTNLFYTFEKAAAAAGQRVLLTINTTYDADGNTATTGDQVPVKYEVELTGTAGGQILRNGSYEFVANIDGLTGAEVNMTVSVADWETLSTETGNVGN